MKCPIANFETGPTCTLRSCLAHATRSATPHQFSNGCTYSRIVTLEGDEEGVCSHYGIELKQLKKQLSAYGDAVHANQFLEYLTGKNYRQARPEDWLKATSSYEAWLEWPNRRSTYQSLVTILSNLRSKTTPEGNGNED